MEASKLVILSVHQGADIMIEQLGVRQVPYIDARSNLAKSVLHQTHNINHQHKVRDILA